MIFPGLSNLADVALLLLRVMIAAIFATSGWSHVTRPAERGRSIGLPPGATFLLGAVEIAGAVAVAAGVYAQIGAILLIAVMLGAIYKKLFVWKTGFWGENNRGWYHDALYLICNLVILTAGAGAIAIT